MRPYYTCLLSVPTLIMSLLLYEYIIESGWFKVSNNIYNSSVRVLGGSVKWPAKLEVSRPNATISEANDTVHFNCTVTGYPQYSLHWVKVCDTVGNDNSTQTSMKTPKNGLTVEGTGKGGKYRCIGKSSTAGPLVRDVTVYGEALHIRIESLV